MFENLLKYVPVPKREDVKVTEADIKEFLNSVLFEVPYRKQYQIGKFKVSFVTPKLNVFDKEVSLDDLFIACLDSVVTEKGTHNLGAEGRPKEEKAKIIANWLFANESPLGYLIIQKFIDFLYRFQALLQHVMSPHFFETDSTK